MWYVIAKLLFKVSGWKVAGAFPADVKKAVMVAAPHTSNWDLIFSRGAFFLMGIPVKFTIKKEWVDAPLIGIFLQKLGAIAIDRNRKSKTVSYVDQMTGLFQRSSQLVVMVTPEGTRKYVPQWRTGFYYIALNAQVPIILGFLDYKNKEAGIGPVIYPNGKLEEQLEEIMAFYRTKTGKYPELGVL
ncbi:MAG: 1-acyl-sn-glycerol-3-phosphate acyltransferase [Candidatus Cyclobacteriaceae bacterium M3_2C_046]